MARAGKRVMNLWKRLSENFEYAWACLWSGRTFAIVLGVIFALIAIALLIASRTRWGHAKPLTKCVIISVMAHVWLLIYACGTRVELPQGDPNGTMNSMAVSLDATRLEPAGPSASLLDEPTQDPTLTDASIPGVLAAWEKPLDASQLPAPDIFSNAPSSETDDSTDDLLDTFEPDPLPSLPAVREVAMESEQPAGAAIDPAFTDLLQPSALPLATEPATSETRAHSLTSTGAPQASTANLRSMNAQALESNSEQLPAEYQLRQSAERLELARPFGADQDTEAAVSAALTWLARAQASDGGWNAKQFGGGTETYALGENRHGTGDRADTGVSGLALLAFLSGGHTHTHGEHQETVQRGLVYLMRSQMPSGDLSGPKQIGQDASVTNARMYCHGIATLALAEAYAMTHDDALRQPLLLAVGYTLHAQDPRSGGWRYRPGDPGDLSQFGWQAMSLRSVERSGIRLDPLVRQRMFRFLDSCATGPSGGLARYRPSEGVASPTMTAEALACRLLLNHRASAAAQWEARNYLLANLPGSGEDNVYYWYYATLALFQLQDESWRRWNVAMKSKLVNSQQSVYAQEAGSWDPDRLWGGYGGRVYSTAMSCLCLEVYYRYLPLYQRN
jgi:hypothetical protein